MVGFASLAGLFVAVRPRTEHGLGSALLSWAAITLLWSACPQDGLDALLKLMFMAGIFLIGGALPSLRPVYAGLALGLTINSGIAIAQWYGWDGLFAEGYPKILTLGYPAGLFVIQNYLAEPAALVLVALVINRMWWFIPGILPSVILPGARGALAAIAAAFVAWLWTKSRFAAVALVAIGLTMGTMTVIQNPGSSVIERAQIWRGTVQGMTLLGNGLGSFATLFPGHTPEMNNYLSRPLHAHNDFLEMVYELGPGILLYVALLGVLLLGPLGAEKLVLIGFLVEGFFAFTLHFPVPAALAALAAGRLCRDRQPLRWRIDLRSAAIRMGWPGAYLRPGQRRNAQEGKMGIPAQSPI